MKIKIISTEYKGLDELIKIYPCLRNFEFEIEKKVSPCSVAIRNEDGSIDNYEFDSTTTYTPLIEINTIEDFFRLGKAVNKNLLFRDDMAIIQIMDELRK